MTSPEERLAAAIASADPFPRLLVAVHEFREEGLAQADVLTLLDRLQSRHESDEDERVYDAICDVMDRVEGFCEPCHAIWPGPASPGVERDDA